MLQILDVLLQIILLAQTKEYLTMHIFYVRGYKCTRRYFLTECCDVPVL